MALSLSPIVLALLVGVVLIAGTINGVAGFGFALVGTMVLATVVDPSTAVVFMIIPIFSVNLSLVRDLSVPQLVTCGRRFGLLMVAALVGTLVGMAALDQIPDEPLRIGLGLISLGFVLNAQQVIPVPGLNRVKEGCFVESPLGMIGVGGVSGLLFGGTNVGVQLVAYLRSCDLSHGLFVGVVAMVFLGLNGVRVVAAGALGLYPTSAVFLLSFGAAIPALGGVALGKQLREYVTELQRRGTVLGLLTLIGIRLVLGGLGIA